MSDSYPDPVRDACAGMYSNYPETRLEAVLRMGQTDFMDCARYLFSMSLYDSSPQIRYSAATALQHMNEDAVVAGLEFEVRNPDTSHRVAAIKLLGRRRVSQSIKPLARFLNDPAEPVRDAALRALEQIGGEGAAGAICDAPITKHTDLEERLETLGRMKERCAVPFLVRVVVQDDCEAAASAIQALGRIGDASVLRILQEAAGHDAAPVRYEAVTALRRFESKRVAPALCAACYDETPGVRKAARDALGSLKLKESAAFLTEALGLQSRRLRLAVLRRLAQLSDPIAAPSLYACLEDDDGEIRYEARAALSKLEVPEGLPLLTGLMRTSTRLRLGAIRRIGKLSDPEAIPSLIPLLEEGDPETCVAAANALGRLHASEAADAVARLLSRPESDVRLAAANALGEFRRRSVLPAIRERLRTFGGEPDARVRLALKRALRHIEAETSARADLPLTAAAPVADPATLPRPVERGGE